MNQKQVIGIVIVLFLAGAYVMLNQTPQNKKNDKIDVSLANFSKLKTQANLIYRDFSYQMHGNPKDDRGPDRDNLRRLQGALETVRRDVHMQNSDFRTQYNQDFQDFRDVDQKIDGLLTNIKSVLQNLPQPVPLLRPNVLSTIQEELKQRPTTIHIDKSVHHTTTTNEAQRLQQIKHGDRIMNEGDRTLNEATRTQQHTQHIGGDTQVKIGDVGNSRVNEGASFESFVRAADIPMMPVQANQAARNAQGSIGGSPNNGNPFDGKPPGQKPDTNPTLTLNSGTAVHIPSIPLAGMADHLSRGTNSILNVSPTAPPTADKGGSESSKPDPSLNKPKVPALPRTHTSLEIPPNLTQDPEIVENPYKQNTAKPAELKRDTEMKLQTEDFGRKRSGSTVDFDSEPPKKNPPKPTPKKNQPIGTTRTQTQIVIPPNRKAENVVVNTPVPYAPRPSSHRTTQDRSFASAPRAPPEDNNPPDMPDKPKEHKKGRLDGYQLAVDSKAKQLITEIKNIESSMEESVTEVDQEMIREFWSKYQDLKFTVPDTIEVLPDLKRRKVKPKVVIKDNKHNRLFNNLYEGIDDNLDEPYIIDDKPLKTLYDVLREYNISATNVKARSPSYAIWKRAIDMVEHERRQIQVLSVKIPKY